MIEHPILFSIDMVRTILDGRKTQTRRVIKPQPADDLKWMGWIIGTGSKSDKSIGCAQWVDEFPLSTKHHTVRCPYGHTGDRLWVKETFAKSPTSFIYRADWNDGHGQEVVDLPTGRTVPLLWKSARFMPHIVSRITLEIVNIRAGLLQKITDDDAIQEGVDRTNTSIPGYARTRFMDLWNSIYFSRPENKWKVNPWVWVIEFKRLEQTP